MARDISDVEKQNPNARQQNDEWRKLRAERGEDPNDAAAFRQHQQAIGAPDPGAGAVKDTAGAKRETEGMKDQLAGTLKAGVGSILRNDQLASDGEEQRQRGSVSRKAD